LIFAFLIGCVPAAVPELALAGRPDHRGQRAEYAGAPLFRWGVPRPVRRRTVRTGSPPPASWLDRVRRRRPAHLLVGFEVGLEARHRPGHRVRRARRLDGVDRNRPKIEFKSATWLPGLADRPGIIPGRASTLVAASRLRSHQPDSVLVGHRGRGRFSVVTTLGMRTKLSRAEMLELVNAQSGEQELPTPVSTTEFA